VNCKRARRVAHEIDWQQVSESPGGERPAHAMELEQHLAACPECRAHVQELHQVRVQLHALGERRAPADFASLTMSKVRLEQRRGHRARRPARSAGARALAAAMAAVVIAAALVYLSLHYAGTRAAAPPVRAGMAPLLQEYSDFRAAQPFGDHDGMAVIRARMGQQQRERMR